MAEKFPSITVGELIERLAAYPDRYIVDFSGLDLSRIQPCGDARIKLELNSRTKRVQEEHVVAEAA